MGEARQYLELRGELTGELPNVADGAANVTLVRVLSVPRMPGVEEAYPWRAIEPARVVESPATETRSMEAVCSLPESRLVDAPVDRHVGHAATKSPLRSGVKQMPPVTARALPGLPRTGSSARRFRVPVLSGFWCRVARISPCNAP